MCDSVYLYASSTILYTVHQYVDMFVCLKFIKQTYHQDYTDCSEISDILTQDELVRLRCECEELKGNKTDDTV